MKIITIVGARPNFVKAAPLCREFEKAGEGIEHLLLHTGQHFDKGMSGDFFETLEIPEPDIKLEVGTSSQTEQTANIMIEFEKVCVKEKPDWVIVVGDVNSTLACSLVAGKMGIHLAHVEAGLRSFDRSMPEEMNRKVTDAVADVLFTPSSDADENLKREGVSPERIKLVGNIMIDTLAANIDKIDSAKPHEKLGLNTNDFIYLTLHRPSNVDDGETLSEIIDLLVDIGRKCQIVFPLHPRTALRIAEFGLKGKLESSQGIHILDPVSYIDSLSFAKNAKLVITDSGGIQEETTYMGTPCLTLRDNTERPVTVKEGTNRLVNPKTLRGEVDKVLSSDMDAGKGECKIPHWDGKTAERIAAWFTGGCRI